MQAFVNTKNPVDAPEFQRRMEGDSFYNLSAVQK